MIGEICAYLRNYFSGPQDRHFGRFEITGGAITPSDFLQDGQFFRIVGSAFNDGVYQFPSASLKDEAFEGAVWAMKVPPALIALADEIFAYEEKISSNGWDIFQSQSFKGYSGSVKGDISWQAKFRGRLDQWRRI